MLASITPLGERGRRSPWVVTVLVFLVAATAAGAAVGALAGALGGLVLGPDAGEPWRAGALAGVLAAALGLELRGAGGPLPGPRRQVDEDWLHAWRGWVYGAGFGAQIGAGVLTVVNSAAVYAALAAAALTGSAARGALVLGVGGLARGAIPLLGARVRAPEALVAFHRSFLRLAGPIRRAVLAAQAVVLVALLGVVAA